MSEIKALEKLRVSEDAAGYQWIRSDYLNQIADEIQVEIDANYMRLPVDDSGNPIQIGRLYNVRYDGEKRRCCGVGELNGKQCVFWASKSYGNCREQHGGWDYVDVIQAKRTVEDVLFDCYAAIEYDSHDGGHRKDEILRKFAQELRMVDE